MKLAILGGSFNPVHLGHLFLADTVLSTLNYNRVVMIPVYRSPFKLDAVDMEISAKDRLDMLAAAVAGDPRLTLDDCEIQREGISYTINTLEDIIERYKPSEKPALIIGDDLAGDFLKWRDVEKILGMADIIIARRNNSPVDISFPHIHINNELMDISSHVVRQRIQAGKNWRSLVPAGVKAIIEDRLLYGFSNLPNQEAIRSGNIINPNANKLSDYTQTVIYCVEATARETLNTERFLHSRNTAILAWDMCRRFGLNPWMGYLAGIAHDLGKYLDHKQLMKLAKTDGMEITYLEKKKPGLLHGRAGAVLLRERFYIHNKDILEAVAFHTSGRDNMGALAKVIYIADKIEVSRDVDPIWRKMCYEEDDLDKILYAVLNKTVNGLQSREWVLCEETLRLLEKMKGTND